MFDGDKYYGEIKQERMMREYWGWQDLERGWGVEN